MKIGITGHQRFDDSSVVPWVEGCIRARLNEFTKLTGLSSLAKGSDQIFARVVLNLGGELEAIVPFPGYEAMFEDARDAASFRELRAQCAAVTTLEFMDTKEQSYLLAGEYISDHSDLLVAVWNGRPAAGLGGTADVVAYALRHGRTVYQINPVTHEAYDLV